MTTAARPHANTQAQARYNAYLDTPRWKALRYLRRRLDGGRCRVCNATVRGELQQAHTIIMALRADIAQLRAERDEAQKNYEFYFDEYRRTCAAGGKHQ